MNPEFYDYVMDRLFKAGALDVYFSPIQMKKNRPAIKLSVILKEEDEEDIVKILLQETSALGVRVFEQLYRYKLSRRTEEIESPWGAIRVKVAEEDGKILNVAPEYDDCKKAAAEHKVALQDVYKYAKEKVK